MKRNFKGDKTKRADRFAQTHRRRIGKKYPDDWAESFTEQVKAEWSEKHPSDDAPKPKSFPNQKK